MHIGVFILLLLSGERNFGVRLNKPYSVRVPMDIPVFTGSHADFLIIVSPSLPLSWMSLSNKLVTVIIRIRIRIRAAGLIALTRRLTRLSINRVKIFNRALIMNFFSDPHSLCDGCSFLQFWCEISSINSDVLPSSGTVWRLKSLWFVAILRKIVQGTSCNANSATSGMLLRAMHVTRAVPDSGFVNPAAARLDYTNPGPVVRITA